MTDFEKAADPIDRHVGERLKLRREALAVTQEQLGAAIGVSFQQVQKYERGLNRLSASRMYHACRALGAPVDYLFADISPACVRKDALRIGADDPMLRSESMEIVRGYWRLTPEQRRAVAGVIGSIAAPSARHRGAKRQASRRNASRAPANNGTDRGDDAATPEARP